MLGTRTQAHVERATSRASAKRRWVSRERDMMALTESTLRRMDMQDPQELLVVAFEGEKKAEEVLRELQKLNHEHLVHLRNAAIITRSHLGKVEIHETHDFDAKQGAVAGALAGGLLGMMRGNLLEGAAIGVAGGMIASKVVDLGFKDDYLRELSQSLTPNSSALVAIVQFEHADQAMQELDLRGGKIIRQTLPADVAQRIAAAVQG